MNPDRIDRRTYYMLLAHVVSLRGTCDRARVGAVATIENRIIATGYNGSPAGVAHCDDVGHTLVDGHCIATIHAEANLLTQAAKTGQSLSGAIVYCTHLPCHYCIKLLLNSGVRAAVYRFPYPPVDQLQAVTQRLEFALVEWTPPVPWGPVFSAIMAMRG